MDQQDFERAVDTDYIDLFVVDQSVTIPIIYMYFAAHILQIERSNLICNDSRNCSAPGHSSRSRRVNCNARFFRDSSINSQGPCRHGRILLNKDHLLRRRKSTASDMLRFPRSISNQNKDAHHRLGFQSPQAFAFVHLRLPASYAVSFQVAFVCHLIH